MQPIGSVPSVIIGRGEAIADEDAFDGALQAIDNAKPVIFKEGWLERVFAPEAVLDSVREICNPS